MSDRGIHPGQLHIIESLPFAPLKKHNIAIERRYTSIMGLELLYDAFQAGKGCRAVRQNLDPVSNLITWHRVKRFPRRQPLYVLSKKKRQNSFFGFIKIRPSNGSPAYGPQIHGLAQCGFRIEGGHVENFPFIRSNRTLLTVVESF